MRDLERFERHVLPHLDAAYNLARWLLRNDTSAEDAVQDASLKAWKHLPSLRGDDARPWLLGIVRNTCFSMLERTRDAREEGGYAESELDALAPSHEPGGRGNAADPAMQLQRAGDRQRVDAAIRALPPIWREVVVLRELEELAYADIARIIGVPVGTVMSRLSRARESLRASLIQAGVGDGHG